MKTTSPSPATASTLPNTINAHAVGVSFDSLRLSWILVIVAVEGEFR